MIRRDEADRHLLITQHEHAQLSCELAKHVGNARFDPLTDHAGALLGIGLHDCGWPLHDDAPTLNPQGLPLDVFESTPEIALRVWTESVERAARQDAYAGLLVSLHVLHLSLLAGDTRRLDAHQRFALNKFHHAQFEWQDNLRRSVGLRVDRPLTHGLLERNADPDEDRLRFHFRWLQALDQISLAICCTEAPFGTTNELHTTPGAEPIALSLARTGDRTVRVDPWPFKTDRLDVYVPGRAVPRGPYSNADALRATYAQVPIQGLRMSLVPS